MKRVLTLDHTRFRDVAGRHVILRGVNFSADAKVPTSPNGQTHLPTDFADHRSVSFVGRPATLSELDEHLARLRHWGFNCLRLLTTWESVEHAGPGQYDEEYLEHFAAVCRRAGEQNFYVFVDFHQDAWSRMSGGCGAPGWTFEAAGLDFRQFHRANAAHVMQYNYDPTVGGRQDSYPMMSWSGNYCMPANGIMWTLFLSGRDFAPTCAVDGENIQDYLQRHYLGAVRALAGRVADMPRVIGFDSLNEPGTGYVGCGLDEPIARLHGGAWTALTGLAVASGLPCRAIAPGSDGAEAAIKNPEGVSIWLPGREDPFRKAGAWDIVGGQAVALRPDYFRKIGSHDVEVVRDYMGPFFSRVGEAIHSVRSDWLLFAEVEPFSAISGARLPEQCPRNTVSAPHWYDVAALTTKQFDPDCMQDPIFHTTRHGRREIEDGYTAQMALLKSLGDGLHGGVPTLMGECGIPFDLNERNAFARWTAGERDASIWHRHVEALDLMYNALDHLLLSSTQWNYTIGNRNDPMIGDGWNQEDLSIWSADQLTDAGDPDSGGRAVEGFCRPYVRASQGKLVRQVFDRITGRFEAEIEIDPGIGAPTEIYVPQRQYRHGFRVEAGHAASHVQHQLLFITADRPGRLLIRIVRI